MGNSGHDRKSALIILALAGNFTGVIVLAIMCSLLGIIIGPIIAALFITIWEIYGVAFKDYLPNVDVILKKRQGDEPV